MLVLERGTGGAFAAWGDGDIHLLHLDPDGSSPPGWIGPEIVCDVAGVQKDARVAPDRGALLAAFELPDASPAQLDLLDITGRRVESREVGALGAGRHTITFRAGAVPPGVYVLRLTRTDGARSVREAILPGSR